MSDENLLIVADNANISKHIDIDDVIFLNTPEPSSEKDHSTEYVKEAKAPPNNQEVAEENIAEIENIELYKESDFIANKPNTVVNNSLINDNKDVHLADFSPLNAAIISSQQEFLLKSLGLSKFFNDSNQIKFQNFGIAFFDSFLSSLRNSTEIKYDVIGGLDLQKYDSSSLGGNFGVNGEDAPVPPTPYDGPTIVNNSSLSTNISGIETITNTLLLATDINTLNDSLVYTITAVPTVGQIELTTNPTVAITTFTQEDLDNGIVVYQHNGDVISATDGFTFDITDGSTTLTGLNFDVAVNLFAASTAPIIFQSPTPLTEGYFSGYFFNPPEVSGNNVIVGDPYDDFGASSSGSIFIFDQNTGTLLHTLNNPDPDAFDYFGYYTQVEGNNLIVTLPYEDTGATNAGSIYIYDIPTGTLVATLNNPTPEFGSPYQDRFGYYSLVDGNNLIVGVGNDEIGGVNQVGSVYIYDIPTGALLRTINNPTLGMNDYFGASHAVSGNNLIASAINDDTGASNAGTIYIFDISTGALLHTLNNPTPGPSESFGIYMQTDGDNLIVKHSRDDLGGAFSGSIYIYDVPTGVLLQTLNNPTPEASDNFGYYTQIDGNNLIVSVPRDNIGASDAGSIYIYDIPTGGLLQTLNNPTPEANDSFGQRTLIDGNNLIVSVSGDDTGASNAGSVYIYDILTGALLQTINNPDPGIGDLFGDNGRTQIAGNNLIVSVPRDDTGASNAGSIYIFDISTGALVHTLNNPTPDTNENFGSNVQIEGDTLITRVSNDDTLANNAGLVYIYDIPTGTLLYTLNSPTVEANGFFGSNIGTVQGADLLYIRGTTAADGEVLYQYSMDLDADGIVTGSDAANIIYGLNGDDTLTGGGGADILYGGNGADVFAFESANAFGSRDRIEDFSVGENDVLDISDILTGYNFGVDNIADFARFVDVGADSQLEIDTNGTAGGVSFQAVALIINGSGLDATALETSSNLDTVV